MTNTEIKQERERMERIGYVDVHELCRDCLIELKQNFLVMLADNGVYAEIMEVDYDEPSQYDLENADEIVPDDVIFYNYDDVGFIPDDFFCLGRCLEYGVDEYGNVIYVEDNEG